MLIYNNPVYGIDYSSTWKTGITNFGSTTAAPVRTIYDNEFMLKDHLGNVRMVITGVKSNGGTVTVNYNDYYPGGSVMPGRSFNPPGNQFARYGYQGKERLLEAGGLYDFGLRMYNSDLMRWLSPDPYHQHYSSYLAMANNPISFIDPNGGTDVNQDGWDDQTMDQLQTYWLFYTNMQSFGDFMGDLRSANMGGAGLFFDLGDEQQGTTFNLNGINNGDGVGVTGYTDRSIHQDNLSQYVAQNSQIFQSEWTDNNFGGERIQV